MVRNLVLTPFIDLLFAHFIFSGKKLENSSGSPIHGQSKRKPDRKDHPFPICADNPIETSLKGCTHD